MRKLPSTAFKKGDIPWNKGLKGYRAGEKNNMWKGGRQEIIECKQCNKKFEDYIANKRVFCSRKCSELSSIGRKPIQAGKPRPEMRGENHPNWKGGYDRPKRIEDIEWRKSIFARDNYMCMTCNSKEKIQAHHIKKWADYPRLRNEINNGITLCYECHKLTLKKEEVYEQMFEQLLKKAVNSGEPLTYKDEGNPEPRLVGQLITSKV